MQRRFRLPLAAAMATMMAAAVPAAAQKNSGPLLPNAPPPMAPRPAAPAYAPAPPVTAPRTGGNPDVERQAQALPLDPQTRELQDQAPPDPVSVQRRLGLRASQGPATDLRGRLASPREIVDALAPR